MDHSAPADHAIHELLRNRWSARAFSTREVSRETLLSLLEAARWAPSSSNEQPWRFIVAVRGDGDAFERLLSTLVDANQVWAKNVPVLVLTIAERAFARNGKPNRHAFHDVGQAVAHLSVEATSLGLAVHQMGGFNVDKAREAFAIPETAEPVAVAAIGYPGDPSTLPTDELRNREVAPRVRRPLSQTVFDGRYGVPAAWVKP